MTPFDQSELEYSLSRALYKNPSFENLIAWFSVYAWEQLKSFAEDSYNEIKVDERTLTNELLIKISKLNKAPYTPTKFRLFHSTDEKTNGSDFEVVYKYDADKYLLFVCQAKRVYVEKRKADTSKATYSMLAHGHEKNNPQVKNLITYATKCDAIPVYVLYNYVETNNFPKEPQLDHIEYYGCSVVSANVINEVYDSGRLPSSLSFSDLHPPGVPLCCLAQVNYLLDILKETSVRYLSKEELKAQKKWRELDGPIGLPERFSSSTKLSDLLSQRDQLLTLSFSPRFRIWIDDEDIPARRTNLII